MTTSLRPLVFLVPAVFVACIDGLVLPGDAHQTLTGNGGRFGFALDLGVHADNNGDLDIAVGEPGTATVHLFDFDAGTFDPSATLATFTGEAGGEAGWSLATGRVVNLDAARDLVIGAPSENGGRGRVYVLQGGTLTGALDASDAYVTIEGQDPSDFAGWDVATGDFDGDGYRDVLVGVCGFNAFRGAVSVVFGPFTPGEVIDVDDPARTMFIRGTPNDGSFGCSVAGGDTDNNGRDDIVVGSSGFSDAAPANGALHGGEGRVWVVYSKAAVGNGRVDDATFVTERHWSGTQAGQSLGFSVDGDGDINGDGIEDLVVGAPYHWCESYGGCGDLHPGAAVLFGKRRAAGNRLRQVSGSIATSADVLITGVDPAGGFGQHVAIVGDHNADGFDDLAIGTLRESKSYVFYGLASPAATFTSASAYGVVDGSADGLALGQTAAGGHDLDGDGRDEVIIGEGGVTWEEAPASDGAAYLFLGAE